MEWGQRGPPGDGARTPPGVGFQGPRGAGCFFRNRLERSLPNRVWRCTAGAGRRTLPAGRGATPALPLLEESIYGRITRDPRKVTASAEGSGEGRAGGNGAV